MLLLSTNYYCKLPLQNKFSSSEMRDIICIYAQTDICGEASTMRFLKLCANRRQPRHKLSKCICKKLSERNTFRHIPDTGGPTLIIVDEEDEILTQVTIDSLLSTPRVSTATGVSRSLVDRLSKENNYVLFTLLQCNI